MIWQTIRKLFYDRRTLLLAFVLGAVIISVQQILLGTHLFVMPKPADIPSDIMNKPEFMNQFLGRRLTEYNNFVIFKASWFHLIHGTNLYGLYPAEHWDFYKYSPTFALLMGSLAYLPDVVGISIFNLLNVLAVFFAIRMLPFKHKAQCLLLWFVYNELLTCVSNSQSNGLMCGLMIAAYACMEHRKLAWATLWLVVATYIKVYGIIGCCLFLFYPGKVRFILYMAGWMILFAVMPLLATTPALLAWQYRNWATLMVADASEATGLSVSGWLHNWFGINGGKYITLTGMVLFLLPFVRVSMYKDRVFKLLLLASMLIWVIIFNHKAESPTYIIAVAGVGIWFFASPRATWRTVLLLFVLVFTSLSTTDFFPPYVRAHYLHPLGFKAVPCIAVWVVIMVELMLLKPAATEPEERDRLVAHSAN